jgi:tetratricopeptide (TPR) repeat protein
LGTPTLTKLFDEGSKAFERGNLDLAIMLWQQLLAMNPDHQDARKLLRVAEEKRWLQTGGGMGAKVMALLKGIGGFIGFYIHYLAKNYDKAMIDAEKVLVHDPTCTPMLWGLANAAGKGGHTEVRVMTLEKLRELEPDSAGVHRALGHAYTEAERLDEAGESWHTVQKLKPLDREASNRLRDIGAMQTMVKGKYIGATEKGASFRESVKNPDEVQDREREEGTIRTDEDLQKRIEKVTNDVEANPGQKRYVIQLGDLYRRAGDIDKARELYRRAIELDSMDYSVQDKLADLRIDDLAREERELGETLEAEPGNAEAKARLEEVKKQRYEYTREELERRIKVRPTDWPLRRQLGDLLFAHRLFEDAAPHYQKGAADPGQRRYCRTRLGLCLFNSGKVQLAVDQFEHAVEGGTAANRQVREILYYLAVALERLGELDRAEETYRNIFEADMGYKDVQERLDKVMAAKSAGSAGAPGAE